ncbi:MULTISPECIES: ice-binding family protein [unclassified Modestobacter]|uniref:ice-binding family protein n=1 Tax=unclassified Modestobacter TaxID=2643866 RepID=UPI0022AA0526|nr:MULTISPECIES: ice-binding family protein [unclassified Modestobacter]MCZ2824412.1 ice-binding family protein [Modestobacter sp. VKM Ac-2981]MCZ2854060.1 ice-binding family protein [Modestobacter sp. VKM Ac-2982]
MASVPSTFPSPTRRTRRARLRSAGARRTTLCGVAVVAASALVLATAGSAQAAPAATAVPLGTAEPFAALSGSSFTNTGPTVIAGDIGASDPSMVGTTSITLTGTNHGNDSVTASANAALTNALVSAAGQGPGDTISADLAGQTLTPGIYTSPSALSIAGPTPLVLDGQGDPNAVFLFQAGSTLITQPGTSVSLINGATACNVFWQVGSSTTLGVNSVFRGVVLTLTDTTMNTGATLEGSVLSSGSVSLDSNTIIRPACATPPSTPPPTTAPPTTTPPTTTASPTAAPDTTGAEDETTYGQVGRVPVGSVDTGDGSTADVPLARPTR